MSGNKPSGKQYQLSMIDMISIHSSHEITLNAVPSCRGATKPFVGGAGEMGLS